MGAVRYGDWRREGGTGTECGWVDRRREFRLGLMADEEEEEGGMGGRCEDDPDEEA